MLCPRCNGQGFSVIAKWKCPKCHGTGFVEQTNDEWFCGLPVKTKAVYFARTQLGKGYWDKINRALHDEDFPEKEYVLKIITDWEHWLKEKHNDNI